MGDVLGFDIDININYDDPSWNDYVEHQNMWCKYQPMLEAKGYRLPEEYKPTNTISISELKKHGSPFILTEVSACFLLRVACALTPCPAPARTA